MGTSSEDGRQCDDHLLMLEETDAQPRILHLARLSLKNKGEMKTYLDLKRNKIQRTFVASRPDL